MSDASTHDAELSAKDKLLGHSYDGIQEYDNPLPGWWSFIFAASVVFAFFYVLYYHFGEGPLVADELQAESARLGELKAAEALKSPVTNDSLVALTKDVGAMTAAKQLFVTKCAACHKEQGQGLIGPNLCDDYWLHGAQPLQIYTTINEGVPAKGMVAWGNQLSAQELRMVAAYVITLRGTDPPDPKAPEGEKVTQ